MELKRILIVEDDADIAAIERDYLELGGYAVTIAPDGTTGLDAALHQPFDLILLDVMLPGIDGFAICKQVRAEKDIPILMVTARGEDGLHLHLFWCPLHPWRFCVRHRKWTLPSVCVEKYAPGRKREDRHRSALP